MKIIDKYIIKNFIGTYFFSITSIICIIITMDFNENLDKFIQNSAPTSIIIFDYYFNFIPYFVNLFSPLFTFISIIFFTSKLATYSEIIAFLSSGVSFRRFMYPYLISACFIAFTTFLLSSYIIPKANIKRIQFHNLYIRDDRVIKSNNIQLAIFPRVIATIENYDSKKNTGCHFSLERFNKKKLCSRMTADQIIWNKDEQWTVKNYMICNFNGLKEEIITGKVLDTILNVHPSDFMISINDCEQMTSPSLKSYIKREKKRGIGNIQPFEIEYHKRYSMAFAIFILTITGVSFSSRKMDKGIGTSIGFGLLLSFSYILFLQISSSFATLGLVSPLIAVWIPNFIYMPIAGFLYKNTSHKPS